MIYNKNTGFFVYNLIDVIQKNKEFLSEVDGKIGDGDHGINMNKGFTMCKEKLDKKVFGLSEGLEILADTLQEDIGGSMGPLYGVMFEEMAAAVQEEITPEVFGQMLLNAALGLQEIGGAKRGDKTLLDTLIPAKEAYEEALSLEKNFEEALTDMKMAAEAGWRSTEGMIAKIGRASRLGERSIGVLDAGATSCYLLLASLADSMLLAVKQSAQ